MGEAAGDDSNLGERNPLQSTVFLRDEGDGVLVAAASADRDLVTALGLRASPGDDDEEELSSV